MPTNDREEVNIKDLPIAVELSNSDTMILIQNGAYTRRIDLGDIVAYTIASPQTELATNHKEVIPAINELKALDESWCVRYMYFPRPPPLVTMILPT